MSRVVSGQTGAGEGEGETPDHRRPDQSTAAEQQRLPFDQSHRLPRPQNAVVTQWRRADS